MNRFSPARRVVLPAAAAILVAAGAFYAGRFFPLGEPSGPGAKSPVLLPKPSVQTQGAQSATVAGNGHPTTTTLPIGELDFKSSDLWSDMKSRHKSGSILCSINGYHPELDPSFVEFFGITPTAASAANKALAGFASQLSKLEKAHAKVIVLPDGQSCVEVAPFQEERKAIVSEMQTSLLDCLGEANAVAFFRLSAHDPYGTLYSESGNWPMRFYVEPPTTPGGVPTFVQQYLDKGGVRGGSSQAMEGQTKNDLTMRFGHLLPLQK